ncbi:hypothetical protein PC129_g18432 [Phytophthora cactorum]|nr:hypothetical protein PC112_g18147 [Phytophthora cactorum]KAG3147734.1 hypothetical protein C6341_g17638 [Phytophthora cactorum]KAG3210570.1 hypothetical protein PC129_g18432 [Phytophthora cactorum]
MSDNQAKARSPLGLEKFNGNKSEFTMWKDKILTHVQQLDHDHEIKTFEKGQPEPTVTMVDFLTGTPEKPVISVSGPPDDEEDKKNLLWRLVYYNRALTGMRNLFNQTLPHSFLSTLPETVSKMDPCEVWKLLEQSYGQGVAGGLIQLKNMWTRMTNSNWKNLRTLFAQLKKERNDINRKTRTLIDQDMVTESWLCMEVLSQLPSEFWVSSIALTPDGFTIDKVEAAVVRVFGEKSRKEIGTVRQPVTINAVRQHNPKKRKAPPRTCRYRGQPDHYKVACPTMATDREETRPGVPLYRTDIWSPPSNQKNKGQKSVRVRTVKKAKNQTEVVSQIPVAAMTNGKTLLEQSIETEHDINELRYIGYVNEDQKPHSRSGSDDMMDVEDK